MKLDPSAFVATPELIHSLAGHSAPLVCDQDRVLFRQGEIPQGVFLLLCGQATVIMTSPSGDQLTQFRVGDGSLLGLPGLIGNRPYTLTATALAGAELRFIDRAEFTLVMQSDPQLALKILEVLAAEVCAARRALSDI